MESRMPKNLYSKRKKLKVFISIYFGPKSKIDFANLLLSVGNERDNSL